MVSVSVKRRCNMRFRPSLKTRQRTNRAVSKRWKWQVDVVAILPPQPSGRGLSMTEFASARAGSEKKKVRDHNKRSNVRQ